MPIFAFPPKSGHTFYYFEPQIKLCKTWDIPSFRYPSTGTQIVTFLGISQLFRSPLFATNRDTFRYIQLICHRFGKRTIGTPFITHPDKKHPKSNFARTIPGAIYIRLDFFLFAVSSTTIPKRDMIAVTLRNTTDE